MEIRIQWRGRVYSICIGYQTKWFDNMSFLTVIEEEFEDLAVVYAKLLFRT